MLMGKKEKNEHDVLMLGAKKHQLLDLKNVLEFLHIVFDAY